MNLGSQKISLHFIAWVHFSTLCQRCLHLLIPLRKTIIILLCGFAICKIIFFKQLHSDLQEDFNLTHCHCDKHLADLACLELPCSHIRSINPQPCPQPWAAPCPCHRYIMAFASAGIAQSFLGLFMEVTACPELL